MSDSQQLCCSELTSDSSVLTIGNKIDFHVVALDRIVVKKDVERTTALLGEDGVPSQPKPELTIGLALVDLTEHLQLRFLPVPTSYNPWFHIRFLSKAEP